MEEIQSGIGGHDVTSGSRSTSPSPTGAKAASEAPDQETKTAEPATAAEEEDTYDSCCICFDGKEFVLTSCCHLFCLPCIKRWVEISGTCPICRNEFGQGVELYSLMGTPSRPDSHSSVLAYTDLGAHSAHPVVCGVQEP